MTSLLAEGLSAAGVDVTLLATLDSVTSGALDGVCPRVRRRSIARRAGVGGDACRARVEPFGRVRRRPQPSRLAAAGLRRSLPGPFAHHGPWILRHGHPARLRDYVATVHHGIDLDAFPFDPVGGRRLTAFGRVHPDKGTHTAIEIARRAGMPLTICGIVQDERYFEEEIVPKVDGEQVSFLRPVGPERRGQILGGAAALLHPIAFDEPFGLSVVEAMACGTPVVPYRRGSMAEVVDPGVTGFLVDSLDEAVTAVARIATIDRAQTERRFSADRMVASYLRIYREMLGQC
ncbi:glycosyltransferase [Nonomuraea diastatica]|uniref:glycosyltransferase n=1 Tax=Nonomuraea diastatica TaxID=1848329 RepID=UPI001C70279F|nr:glycosyltransferase [Nonomuraea diastatica]